MRKALLLSVGLALGLSIVCLAAKPGGEGQVTIQKVQEPAGKTVDWPVLKRYDEQHLAKIALPLGGIGTGTVSLGGRGDLRDWEIMNRPAKGFTPMRGSFGPFFAVFVKDLKGTDAGARTGGAYRPVSVRGRQRQCGHRTTVCRASASAPSRRPIRSGRSCSPTPDMPVDVTLQAFNPLVPCDPETSGIPVAILRYVVRNKTNQPLEVSVCGNMPNFIGNDGSGQTKDHKGDLVAAGGKANRNEYREGKAVNGIFMSSRGSRAEGPAMGHDRSDDHRARPASRTGSRGFPAAGAASGLDFWDDFSADGKLDEREAGQGGHADGLAGGDASRCRRSRPCR